MDASSSRKRILPTYFSTEQPSVQRSNKITLNYGIEIEAVFELINEYIAYNQFINYYIHNKESGLATIEAFINIIITCIKKPESETEGIRYEINKLKENIIYKNLISTYVRIGKSEFTFLAEVGEYDDSESDNEGVPKPDYIKNRLEKLIDTTINKPSDQKTINNIQNWSEFINTGIKIIKHMLEKLDSQYTINDVITVLNIPEEIQKSVFTAFTNIFDFKLNKKIKLYKINIDIDDFYYEEQKEDELCLCLTPDESVICDNKKVYKNISSGEIVKSYKLLNNCEFISKPFESIDDIKKLRIFFDDPIIKNTLLNCEKTSQHVHISFNRNDRIIKPDLYIVLSIVCICYLFQDEIFKLFLITRSENKYCKKLNYDKDKIFKERKYYDAMYTFDDITDITDYNENIIRIFKFFYTQGTFDDDNISENRYFWLNILNLYEIGPIKKPYTIEFRLKHGSTDVEELQYVCKLYENIINYATELLQDNEILKPKLNIIDFITEIETLIDRNKENIFNEKILKNICQYFTASAYTRGLNKLNQQLRPLSITDSRASSALRGGKKQNIIDEFIDELENKEIYRFNSFGIEYIGKGLDTKVQNNLKAKFLKNDTLINKDLKEYLNSNNIYYDIPTKTFIRLINRKNQK